MALASGGIDKRPTGQEEEGDGMVEKKTRDKASISHHNPCWRYRECTISVPYQCYVHMWIYMDLREQFKKFVDPEMHFRS
jgi:hypothetical protein